MTNEEINIKIGHYIEMFGVKGVVNKMREEDGVDIRHTLIRIMGYVGNFASAHESIEDMWNKLEHGHKLSTLFHIALFSDMFTVENLHNYIDREEEDWWATFTYSIPFHLYITLNIDNRPLDNRYKVKIESIETKNFIFHFSINDGDEKINLNPEKLPITNDLSYPGIEEWSENIFDHVISAANDFIRTYTV